MFKCIRCLVEFPDTDQSEEHIFPEAIGGTIKITHICKKCNSEFGSHVDGPFVNNWLIDSRRMLLGIKGKSGQVPNPLENGVMSTDPSHKVRYVVDTEKPRSIYTIPNVEHGVDENGNQTVSIRLDKSDEDKLPEILDSIRRRLARDGKSIDPKSMNRQDVSIEKPWVKENFTFDIYCWQRGIIKIAYELAYRYLGVKYLDDPIAQSLRDVLLPEDVDENTFVQHPVRGSLELGPVIKEMPFMDDPHSLYGALFHVGKSLVCVVKIFDVFHGRILVSDSLDPAKELDGLIVRIDVPNKKTTEEPFLQFLVRMIPDTDI